MRGTGYGVGLDTRVPVHRSAALTIGSAKQLIETVVSRLCSVYCACESAFWWEWVCVCAHRRHCV